MLKKDELATPTSCLNKAGSHEPVFVLRAKDPLAAMTVRHWATMAHGFHEPAKIDEAFSLAMEMDRWYDKFFRESLTPATPKPSAADGADC